MTIELPSCLSSAERLLYLTGAIHHKVTLCEGALRDGAAHLTMSEEPPPLSDVPDLVRASARPDLRDDLLGLVAATEATLSDARALLLRRWMWLVDEETAVPSGGDRKMPGDAPLNEAEFMSVLERLNRLWHRIPILFQLISMPDLDTHGIWLAVARDEFRVNKNGSVTAYASLEPDERRPQE
ncbi:hypothetical protein ACFPER_12080 [Agromyces aurantiacus]|uniref:DUF2017 family protein n=1 Tax=Agromyces aurantiacus TaxID=165814 RepID=A0ABV9RB13_9MICO|nr:hypothetical protein [Agromyces aurantiacus]MBM7504219.1 hypothetical protein [Agromyces aurantiacus]